MKREFNQICWIFVFTAVCVGLSSCNSKEDGFVIVDTTKVAPPPGPHRGLLEEITVDQYAFSEHIESHIPRNIDQDPARDRSFSRGGLRYELVHTPQANVEIETDTGTEEAFDRGDGSASDPYGISNAFHLANIDMFPNAHYVLKQDLDLPQAINPIALERPFTGVFDGQSFRIRNLKLTTPEGVGLLRMGLFAQLGLTVQEPMNSVAISFGIVKNLILETTIIEVNTSADQSYVGALAGVCEGRIINCHIIGGSIRGTSNDITAGGIVGKMGQGAGIRVLLSLY